MAASSKPSCIEDEYRHLGTVLASVSSFVEKHPSMSYIEFDYYAVHDLTLFFVEPDFSFTNLQENITIINKALPSLKRIFAKPIIALKDTSSVLPVELVSKINQNSLNYLANHLNTADNVKEGRVMPRKLLTSVYEDDYGLYENLIVCGFADEVLSYIRKNVRTLKSLLYESQTMEFNLLERLNHIDYYLALGKLHTGYIRDFEKNYGLSRSLYTSLSSISDVIVSRLHKPLYQKNKRMNKNLALKKTNIFLMQKDYHQIYIAYKYLKNHASLDKKNEEKPDLVKIRKDYFSFLKILSVFALGHFNFTLDKGEKLDIGSLEACFSFKKWKIRLIGLKQGLYVSVTKDKAYSFLLVPCLSKEDMDASYSKADEVILCTPFEDLREEGELLISMENIDSFRRLQQVFLKGMVYADKDKKDCPFCPGSLIYDKDQDAYICPDCRTVIKKKKCQESGKYYFITLIDNYNPVPIDPFSYSKEDRWLYLRDVEGLMYYRNITLIDEKGQALCPYCHQVSLKPVF